MKSIHCLRLVLLALLIAVRMSPGAEAVDKTKVLPDDGGELGNSFAELRDALKTGDRVRASRLLDPSAWHLDNKQPSWFEQISEQLSNYSPAGGRCQGDRATLFVVTGQPYYAMMNASYADGNWRFDSPVPRGCSFSPLDPDRISSPSLFPSGVLSAPDAEVAGTVQSYMIDPDTQEPLRPVVLFDGMAVRMLDKETKALKSTWILLAGTGINPSMVALSEGPDQVKDWLSYPLLTLEIAPDGKSSKLEYFNGYTRSNLDVTNGLTVTQNVTNRIQGRLKTDEKGVASFDVTFDISMISECIAGED